MGRWLPIDAAILRVHRFRFLFIVLGIIIYVFGLIVTSPNNYPYIFEIFTWLSTILIVTGGLSDVLLYNKTHKLLPLIVVEIIGIIMTVIGRLGATLYIEYLYNFYAPPLCPSTSLQQTLFLQSLILSGGLTILIAQTLYLFLERSLESIKEKPNCIYTIRNIAISIAKIKRLLIKQFIVTAFIIAFILRLLPEIYTWPLPIGWDTVEYISYLRDYAIQMNPFKPYFWMGSLRNIPPLMAIVLSPFIRIIDPWLIMKIWEPVMIGLISMLSAIYVNKVLKTSRQLALVAGLSTALNIAVLGSSQQWARHMLGLVTLLIFLILSARESLLGSTLSLLAMSAAYEITALLATILSLYEIYKNRKMIRRVVPYILVFILSVLILLWYIWKPSYPQLPVSSVLIGRWYWPKTINLVIGWTLMFLVGLIPAIKFMKKINVEYNIITVTLLLLFISPFLCPYFSFPIPHRAITLLVALLFPLAIVGWRVYSRAALALFLIVYLSLGLVYVSIPLGYLYSSPIRLVNNGAFDCCGLNGFPWPLRPIDPALYNCMKNISRALNEETNIIVVVEDTTLYNLLHLYIREPSFVYLLGFRPNEKTIMEKISDILNSSKSQIYLITRLNQNDLRMLINKILHETNIQREFNIKLILTTDCDIRLYLIYVNEQ